MTKEKWKIVHDTWKAWRDKAIRRLEPSTKEMNDIHVLLADPEFREMSKKASVSALSVWQDLDSISYHGWDDVPAHAVEDMCCRYAHSIINYAYQEMQ